MNDSLVKINLENFLSHLLKKDSVIIDLSEANLLGYSLLKINLLKANLNKINFYGASLNQAIFIGANLSEANLSKAKLLLANLNEANLSGANLSEANLLGADLSEANLSGANVTGANLLGADLPQANLSGANLLETNLSEANLSGANLSGANLLGANLYRTNLSGANLSGANLLATRALATYFNKTNFTGACIQDWNINIETNLNNINCKFIYLKREWNEEIQNFNFVERRPANGIFNPGDFTRLFQKVRETVDLIFRDGIDWRSFAATFQELQQEQKLMIEGGDRELSIRAIETRDDGSFVIRIDAPDRVNKAELEQSFKSKYIRILKAREEIYRRELDAKQEQIEIYKQESADFKEIIQALASKPIYISQNQGDRTTNQSRNLTISDNAQVNASGAGAFNSGDISGTVANTINQLPTSPNPDQPGIKELLSQLKDAIEVETGLDETDKNDALEEVQNLAEVSQEEDENTKKIKAGKSLRMLGRITKALPPTAALMTICKDLLPAIAHLFSL